MKTTLAAAKIADDVLPHVVKNMVDTGRMARPERFISVAVGMRVRSEVLNMATGD